MKNPAQSSLSGQWRCLYRVAATPENAVCAMDSLKTFYTSVMPFNYQCLSLIKQLLGAESKRVFFE